MDGSAAPLPVARSLACSGCGAMLEFVPGAAALVCSGCGTRNEPPATDAVQREAVFAEHDYLQALQRLAAGDPALEARVVDCPSCGARSPLAGHVAADRCAFCTAPLLPDSAHTQRLLQPQALIPFALDRGAAQQVFQRWVAGRWFAPNALARTVRQADGVRGVYTPWWCFDARAFTQYQGERGVNRQVRESGRSGQADTVRTVTDWSPASGSLTLRFDDALVVASPSIPAHLARVLGDWKLEALRPCAADWLAGFTVESYRVGLEEGFAQARAGFEPRIDAAIRRDIGGDAQRIHSRQTRFDEVRFKHLLLPVWIGSYRFGESVFQVVVNGQTGEVEGDRPYSAWKIAAAVVAVCLVAAVLWGLQGN